MLTPTGSFSCMEILQAAKTQSFTLECSVASPLLACSVGSTCICVWTGQTGACYRPESEQYCDMRLNIFFLVRNIEGNWKRSSKIFDVKRAVQPKYIPFDIFPTRCNFTQFIYFWKTALHVSGGIFTHHQEHI